MNIFLLNGLLNYLLNCPLNYLLNYPYGYIRSVLEDPSTSFPKTLIEIGVCDLTAALGPVPGLGPGSPGPAAGGLGSSKVYVCGMYICIDVYVSMCFGIPNRHQKAPDDGNLTSSSLNPSF